MTSIIFCSYSSLYPWHCDGDVGQDCTVPWLNEHECCQCTSLRERLALVIQAVRPFFSRTYEPYQFLFLLCNVRGPKHAAAGWMPCTACLIEDCKTSCDFNDMMWHCLSVVQQKHHSSGCTPRKHEQNGGMRVRSHDMSNHQASGANAISMPGYFREKIDLALAEHRRGPNALHCLVDYDRSLKFPPDTPIGACRLLADEPLVSATPFQRLDLNLAEHDYDPFAFDVGCLGSMFQFYYAVRRRSCRCDGVRWMLTRAR